MSDSLTFGKPGLGWILIPARGGSVGIPRKNLRMLGGKPLVQHAIFSALSVLDASRVVVVTDDSEIAAVAAQTGAKVVLESNPTPAAETLDEKVVRNLPVLRAHGARDDEVVLTIQPTSPLLKPSTITTAFELFGDRGTGSVLSVADDRHLRWRVEHDGAAVPAFRERVNRQALPQEFRETGGVIGARLRDIERMKTRIIAPVKLLPLSRSESVDIDTYEDLYSVAHLMSRRRIAIRVDASSVIGMGHVYRMLALASELARHDLHLFVSRAATLAQRFFEQHPYHLTIVDDDEEFYSSLKNLDPHLVVLDILDTERSQIQEIRRSAPHAKVVSFEDRGTGAPEADLLVAEFVQNDEVPLPKQLRGVEYALLSPAFEIAPRRRVDRALPVAEILVLFGGTDPSGLAARALHSLARVRYQGHVTAVRGLGSGPLSVGELSFPYELEIIENSKDMPRLMDRADLAFTSAGRTVVELLEFGVPSICLAQNAKEMTHSHAVKENGVFALGLGRDITDSDLDAAVRDMILDHDLRVEFADRAARAGSMRDNRKTIAAILSRVGFEDFPEI